MILLTMRFNFSCAINELHHELWKIYDDL